MTHPSSEMHFYSHMDISGRRSKVLTNAWYEVHERLGKERCVTSGKEEKIIYHRSKSQRVLLISRCTKMINKTSLISQERLLFSSVTRKDLIRLQKKTTGKAEQHATSKSKYRFIRRNTVKRMEITVFPVETHFHKKTNRLSTMLVLLGVFFVVCFVVIFFSQLNTEMTEYNAKLDYLYLKF